MIHEGDLRHEGTQLKPCPFCGSTNVHITDAWPHYLYCIDCGIKMQARFNYYGDDGIKTVANAWNRRVNDG